MTTVVIVVHLMVVLAMIGLVLLQRSEGGALGIGGGQGAFISGRSAGNVLTRSTAVLAMAFFLTSLSLALISKYQSRPTDILERIPGQTAPATTQGPTPPTEGAPATAADLLKQLGGEATPAPAGGPQTPPATSGTSDSAAPPQEPAPAPTPAPAPSPAPAAQSAPVAANGQLSTAADTASDGQRTIALACMARA